MLTIAWFLSGIGTLMLLWQGFQCVRGKAWKKLVKLILLTIFIFVSAYLIVLVTVFIAHKYGGDNYSLSFFGIFLILPMFYGVGTIWLASRIRKERANENA